MTQPFSRIVAVALLGVMVAAAAGTICLVPGAAHPVMTGCHHRIPSHPQPADYRCCVGRHASLPSAIFSVHPAAQVLEGSDAIILSAAAGDSNVVSTVMASSSGPPGVLVLRI
jgi:hypothetical protein